ncbi:hypothetical protein BDV12DRAFT_187362 [Aspergillus spectabilis]
MSKPPEQKHHFIPRFILRKFAPAEQPPAWPAASSKKESGRRDFLVNKIDLENSILIQQPVSTEFALVNMYRDPGFDENPYHLEEKLSQLENKASKIINRAVATFAKSPVLELKRPEVHIVRKFLFHENYDAEDRPRVLRYMKGKGFTKPRDMDATKTWRRTLRAQIYPDDATMFELHLLHSYMSICQPQNTEDKFLLTENAFGIFEGPSTVQNDILTDKTEPVIYTDGVLPFPGDSGDYEEIRGFFAAVLRSGHLEPDRAGSILEDLPVRPCKTVYKNAVVNYPASFSKSDEFFFLCFKLSSAHMTTMNNLFLEEAFSTPSIIYHSLVSLRACVEKYFKDDRPGLKHVIDMPRDRRRSYFSALEKILRNLGGSARCKISPADLSKARILVHMALSVGWIVDMADLLSHAPERPRAEQKKPEM